MRDLHPSIAPGHPAEDGTPPNRRVPAAIEAQGNAENSVPRIFQLAAAKVTPAQRFLNQ
jgi:hypothetical protein